MIYAHAAHIALHTHDLAGLKHAGHLVAPTSSDMGKEWEHLQPCRSGVHDLKIEEFEVSCLARSLNHHLVASFLCTPVEAILGRKMQVYRVLNRARETWKHWWWWRAWQCGGGGSSVCELFQDDTCSSFPIILCLLQLLHTTHVIQLLFKQGVASSGSDATLLCSALCLCPCTVILPFNGLPAQCRRMIKAGCELHAHAHASKPSKNMLKQ